MSEPLHVQVARALGWTEAAPILAGEIVLGWAGIPPGSHSFDHIPPFDTSWEVTGPLLERYTIELHYWFPESGPRQWCASLDGHYSVTGIVDYEGEAGYGATPLLAICNLILALSAAGKLEV